MAGCQREVGQRPAIPAVRDAPRVRQAHEIRPRLLLTPVQDGAAGEATIADQHGGEAGGTGIGQEIMQVIEEGELEVGDLGAHGAVLVGAPQKRDAAPSPRHHRLQYPKLAAGGGIDDDGQVLAVTGAPGEGIVGERAAQDTAIDAWILGPAPQLLIARGEVAIGAGATGQVGQAQGALTHDEFNEQVERGGLLWQQRRPDGLDDGGERAIPWQVSGLLTD